MPFTTDRNRASAGVLMPNNLHPFPSRGGAHPERHMASAQSVDSTQPNPRTPKTKPRRPLARKEERVDPREVRKGRRERRKARPETGQLAPTIPTPHTSNDTRVAPDAESSPKPTRERKPLALEHRKANKALTGESLCKLRKGAPLHSGQHSPSVGRTPPGPSPQTIVTGRTASSAPCPPQSRTRSRHGASD